MVYSVKLIRGTFRADVIISDIGMPEQDGYEFIRAARNNGNKTGRGPRAGSRVEQVARR